MNFLWYPKEFSRAHWSRALVDESMDHIKTVATCYATRGNFHRTVLKKLSLLFLLNRKVELYNFAWKSYSITKHVKMSPNPNQFKSFHNEPNEHGRIFKMGTFFYSLWATLSVDVVVYFVHWKIRAYLRFINLFSSLHNCFSPVSPLFSTTTKTCRKWRRLPLFSRLNALVFTHLMTCTQNPRHFCVQLLARWMDRILLFKNSAILKDEVSQLLTMFTGFVSLNANPGGQIA